MWNIIRKAALVADVLKVIALITFIWVDNTVLEAICCAVLILSCITNFICLCTGKKHDRLNT